jgi:hypothetical protein
MHFPNCLVCVLGVAVFIACAPATAGVHKCTGPDGKVTFTERACEGDQQQTGLRTWGSAAPAPAAVPGAGTRPAGEPNLPYVRTTDRCNYLEKNLDQAVARDRTAFKEGRAQQTLAMQQRLYFEEAYRKECIDERARAEHQRKQGDRDCVNDRRGIEELKRVLALNENRPEAAHRLREQLLRGQQRLAEKCPS